MNKDVRRERGGGRIEREGERRRGREERERVKGGGEEKRKARSKKREV